MATLKNFEDLEIWKKSRSVTKFVYQDFRSIRDFSFKEQIQRASVSIMNNISEGFCRQTKKEKINFLNFAKGSAGEVKNMYYIAEDLDYLSKNTCMERRESIQGLMNGTSAFINYLKSNKAK
jgi:four helix bundle protein